MRLFIVDFGLNIELLPLRTLSFAFWVLRLVINCVIWLEVHHFLNTHKHLHGPMLARLPDWEVEIQVDLAGALVD